MPPKRAAKRLSSDKAKKMRRLTNEGATNSGIGRASASQIQELERALDQDDNNSRVLYLAREIATTPNLPSNLTMRLLKFCVRVGSEYVVRQLLENHTINIDTREGGEMLWTAVDQGQDEIAAMMVRHGANLNVRKGDDNHTILHAVLRSYEIKSDAKREELARLMLDRGADVNARDAEGYSVLRDAIKSKHCSSQLVEELLDRGALVTVKGTDHLNDVYWASRRKPELLPRLVEHQVPDEETRNRRGAMALEYLIENTHTGARLNAEVRMVKKILDLGVPANGPDPFSGKRRDERPRSLLDIALKNKKRDAIKLLLEYGADPHQKDDSGRTPLYQASIFKGYTHASRWLIERGASIHERSNDGCYPIHAACLHNSLRNIHLFVNLGADLNVFDNEGRTPFRYTDDTYKFNEAHALVIKHFALIIAKGEKISDEDLASANTYVWGNGHFRKCTNQLEQMKVENICDGVSYFSLLSQNMYGTLRLMKNPTFARNFKRNSKMRANMFPNYSYMLLHSFEIAEIRYKMLLEEMKHVQQAFGAAIPESAIEKITYYLCFEKLKRCQRDYYMSLHANLKNTKADKEKIL